MNSDQSIKMFNLNNQEERKLVEELNKSYETPKMPELSDQARFFKTKGRAFKLVWNKRLKKGLTPEMAFQLKRMIDAFVESEKNAS